MPTCPSKSSRIRTQLTPCRQQPRAGGRWPPTVAPGPVEDSVLKACPLLRHLVSTCCMDASTQGAPTQSCTIVSSLPNLSCCSLVLLPKAGTAGGGGALNPRSFVHHGVPWGLPLKHFSSPACSCSSGRVLEVLQGPAPRPPLWASCLSPTLCRAAGVLFQHKQGSAALV